MNEGSGSGGGLEEMVRRVVAQVLRERDGEVSAASSEDDLLSQAEAAALARVSVSTIRNWQREGLLAKHGTGRVVRVSRAQLLALTVARGPEVKADVDADAWAAAALRRRG